jgi:cell division protein FtsN
VACVALVLLTAGGYGVMQQRAATEEELRQLRAALATTASPEEVKTSREALQNMQQSHDKLSANAEALTLENRRLADTVASLQAQLGVQQAVLTKAVPAANQTEPATAAEVNSPRPVAPPAPVASKAVTPATDAIDPATTHSAAAASSGPWFVNFGSYASRSAAESWSTRLHPGAGRVIIVPSAKDGQTLYRLRVVGLSSKSSAEEVARKLEGELRVSRLWVGRE